MKPKNCHVKYSLPVLFGADLDGTVDFRIPPNIGLAGCEMSLRLAFAGNGKRQN